MIGDVPPIIIEYLPSTQLEHVACGKYKVHSAWVEVWYRSEQWSPMIDGGKQMVREAMHKDTAEIKHESSSV